MRGPAPVSDDTTARLLDLYRHTVIRDIWGNLHLPTCRAAPRRALSDPAFPFAVGCSGRHCNANLVALLTVELHSEALHTVAYVVCALQEDFFRTYLQRGLSKVPQSRSRIFASTTQIHHAAIGTLLFGSHNRGSCWPPCSHCASSASAGRNSESVSRRGAQQRIALR
jgi:hypothetical protein